MANDDTSPHHSTAPESDLPVPAATAKTYVEVRPTTDAFSPETVELQIRRLHQLGRGRDDQRGWLSSLRGGRDPPTIECLLVATREGLTYLFGVDDPTVLDALERHLRGLFPDSYDLTRTTRRDDHLTGLLPSADPAPTVAAVEFTGTTDRRTDWQTQLTPFADFRPTDHARLPLTPVVETMAAHDCPMVLQVLFQPLPDWSHRAEERRYAIETAQDTLGGKVSHAIFGDPSGDPETDERRLPAGDETRLAELDARDARRSFVVNARIVAVDSETPAGYEDPEAAVGELTAAFADVSRTTYEIEGHVRTGAAGQSVFQAIRERHLHPPAFERLATRLPWVRNRSRGIVVDAAELPNFCLVSGAVLTDAGARAVATTPSERTGLPRPPASILDTYREEGMVLGHPLTADGTVDPDPLVLPPSLQALHVLMAGRTGSGKSTTAISAMLENHEATDGPEILIEPKGDGMAIDYLRAHYARHGTLDDVTYFDCSEVLPAFGFFDIRDQLAAGIPRTTAVEDVVDHYIEVLEGVMGRERFEQAVRSPDVIRYLVKALFDPVNGADAFSHRRLIRAVRMMHERQVAPAVSDPDLEEMLGGVVATDRRSFDRIMAGVATRVEKVPADRRLARLFNHVPQSGDGNAHFDLADHLNEDRVVVFDLGGLRSEAKRVLTLVILSNLWTALKRRAARDDDRRLVNLYVEEAPSVAASDLLGELLSQSRGFELSLTLLMQYPGQLRAHGQDVYDEVLNNVGTVLTGNIPADEGLATRLATDDMSPAEVSTRLRSLRRGQWFVSTPAAFDETEPRPFLLRSTSPPVGSPASTTPVSSEQKAAFEAERTRVQAYTQATAGVRLAEPSAVDADATPNSDVTPESDVTVDADAATTAATGDQSEDADGEDTDTTAGDEPPRVDSALPHTRRMPNTVEYVPSVHGLACTRCESRYDPDIEGMRRAISCCSSLSDVDRDDVPVCDLNLKLTPEERDERPWSDRQLLFVQAVYNAQQLRYDPLEYDLCTDSMIRLQEYTGIDADAVQDLLDADILRHDADHPHRLFSVSPEGRSVIGERYREGVDYGHGHGDLEESSEHVFAIEVARRYLEAEYVDDPDSRVTEVIPYYDLDDQHRLDVAGVDDEENIVVAVEAERVNHDVRRAVPEDFDKIASCDVEEAIWVVMTQTDGHAVLGALNDPLEGMVRVEKTYAKTTPPQQFRIDTPGLTAMYPAEWLRDRLADD